MTQMQKTEATIQEQLEEGLQHTSVGDAGSPIVISVMKEYLNAWNAVSTYFEGITECRKFVDENLMRQTKSIGGQKMYPVMRKMSEAHRHPDAATESTPGLSQEQIVVSENTTRELNKKMKIDNVWRKHSKDIDTDGVLVERIIPSKYGWAQSKMLDRRSILFDANAQSLDQDEETGAIYAFETEQIPYGVATPLYSEKYKEQWAKVQPGSPSSVASQNKDNQQSQKTTDQQAVIDSNSVVGIVTVRCRISPVSSVFYTTDGLMQIKRGEPFEMKIAGGTGIVLYSKSGEDYEFYFPEVLDEFGQEVVEKEAYLPYTAYSQTTLAKGMISPSICSLTMPYFLKIIYYNALEDRNVKLLASPVFHGTFTGPDAQHLEETFKYQLQMAMGDKKLTDFYTTRGQQGSSVDWNKLSPDQLDLAATANRRKELERDVMEIVGILIDDTEFKKGELLGIRQFQEQAQQSAISHFQKLNIPNFARHDKIVLAQFMSFYPEHRNDPVEIKGGIEGFTYTKTLAELKGEMGPRNVYVNFKYAGSRPTGAIAAAADMDAQKILAEAQQMFPTNTEVSTALLKMTAKVVNEVAGSDVLDEKRAIEQVEKAEEDRKAQEEMAMAAEQGMVMPENGQESPETPMFSPKPNKKDVKMEKELQKA